MSSFTWLDSSEHDRRKALDVIDLFRERNTRDELGLGAVRDAFGEILFPGTSTIQTRARYFLFIPWIYQALERRRIRSDRVSDVARRQEFSLIDALANSSDPTGTIGIDARKTLKRLASNVYWQGLGRLGIRLCNGSQDQYHRSLDRHYRLTGTVRIADDGETVARSSRFNWHPSIPAPPTDFPQGATFALTRDEAEYLRERVLTSAPKSFLAFLLDRGQSTESVDFPWVHPQIGELPLRMLNDLEHARNFSEALHGAALLYNLMLAEKCDWADYVESYGNEVAAWEQNLSAGAPRFAQWDRTTFWEVARRGGTHISLQTVRFVDQWIDRAVIKDRSNGIVNDDSLRRLIHNRERALKRGQARLDNQRALERWGGAAGAAQLVFRWPQVQVIVADVLEGLGR